MPNTPDVRVRLSAEGVDDVVNAFKKVGAEAEKSGKGVEILDAATEKLKSVLEAFGVGLGLAEFVEFGKSALENAQHVTDMAQKLGISTEMMSVFSLAAREAGVDQEKFGQSLAILGKNQDLAASGSLKQIDAFQRLGISMQDVRTKDPGQMFLLLAEKLEKVNSSSARLNITQTLLGKGGSELLGVMEKLGKDGYDAIAEKAQRFGIIVDQDVKAAIERANSDIADMQAMAQGMATQFLTGLAPAASDAMEEFNKALTEKGVNGLRTLGEYAGTVVKAIVAGFLLAGQTVGFAIAYIAEKGANLKQTGKDILSGFANGGIYGAASALALPSTDAEQGISDAYFAQVNKTLDDLFGKNSSLGNGGRRDTGKKNGSDDGGGNATKIQQARIAKLKADIDNELALTKLRDTTLSQQNDRDYKDSLKSLEDYYNQRESLINTEADAEIDALKKKITLENKEPAADPAAQLKKQQALAALQNQIIQTDIKRNSDLKAAEDDRHNAEVQAGQETLALNAKIAAAEGDRFQAARLALDQEIQKLDEEMIKLGVTADARRQALAAFRSAGLGQIGFDQASEKGNLATAGLNLDIAGVQRQANSGAISGIEAQGQINALQQNRLDTLKAIGAELTRNAALSNKPELIQQAADYNSKLKDMEASLHAVVSASAELTQQLATTGRNDLQAFFTDGITGAKSFGQAWSDLGTGFEKIVADMVSQLVTFYILLEALKFINPTAASALQAQGPFGKGFSGGGYTGDGGRYQPAGIVHKGEFVFDQDTTKKYLPLLTAMAGGRMPSLSATRGLYSSGGYVDGGESGPPVEINVINNTGQPVTSKQRSGSNGQQIYDLIIGAVASDIAQGGRTAQAVQQTFGAQRSGVKRG